MLEAQISLSWIFDDELNKVDEAVHVLLVGVVWIAPAKVRQVTRFFADFNSLGVDSSDVEVERSILNHFLKDVFFQQTADYFFSG